MSSQPFSSYCNSDPWQTVTYQSPFPAGQHFVSPSDGCVPACGLRQCHPLQAAVRGAGGEHQARDRLGDCDEEVLKSFMNFLTSLEITCLSETDMNAGPGMLVLWLQHQLPSCKVSGLGKGRPWPPEPSMADCCWSECSSLGCRGSPCSPFPVQASRHQVHRSEDDVVALLGWTCEHDHPEVLKFPDELPTWRKVPAEVRQIGVKLRRGSKFQKSLPRVGKESI